MRSLLHFINHSRWSIYSLARCPTPSALFTIRCSRVCMQSVQLTWLMPMYGKWCKIWMKWNSSTIMSGKSHSTKFPLIFPVEKCNLNFSDEITIISMLLLYLLHLAMLSHVFLLHPFYSALFCLFLSAALNSSSMHQVWILMNWLKVSIKYCGKW